MRISEYICLFLRDRNTRQLFIHGVENAQARRAVKADVHMNSIFFSQPDGSVDRFDPLLVDGEEIRSGPEAVIHRQAHPVESPVANPAKVVLQEHPIVLVGEIFHPIGISGEILEEIKAVPTRIRRRRCEASTDPAWLRMRFAEKMQIQKVRVGRER